MALSTTKPTSANTYLYSSAVPHPSSSSSPTFHQEPGPIYLGSVAHPPTHSASPLSTCSQTSSESPDAAYYRYTAPSQRPESSPSPSHDYFSHDAPQHYSRTGPLPPPHHLTLPPIDSLSMSAFISPQATPGAGPPRVMSMTSKEWVIPPRPKPGRKPATDTPPTKRKAQNRAAQRAFRERRAARVGELEEQLQMQKDDHDKADSELKEKVRELELEVQSFRSRCLLLESMLEKERKERIRAETEVESLKHRQQDRSSYQQASSPSANHQGHHRRSASIQQDHRHNSLPHVIPSSETDHNDITSQPPLTCGSCRPNSCSCADAAMAAVTSAFGGQPDTLKRPASPNGSVRSDKRHRLSIVTSVPSPSAQEHSATPTGEDDATVKDGCGFCKEGTYCVCADAAMNTPAMTPTTETLPPIIGQTSTPPPSEPDSGTGPGPLAVEITADGAVKLPRRTTVASKRPAPPKHSSARGCGPKGPGSCAQCQADPKSGLFCRLMASKLGGGCCGGKGSDGGCCKTKKPEPKPITLPSLPSLGLTCAEAYQTLSSHRNFDKASDDIGSWLPKLRATPAGAGAEASKPSRMMPMEVEAASIMSVLKDFDVRFGSAH